MLEVLGVPEHVHAFERACVWLGLAGLVACAVTCVILFVARVVDKFSRRIRVTEIWIYPIKSAGGVRVESARVDRAGLRWDREFAVASRCGAILSQKAHPRLAAIAPTLEIGRAGELAALTLTSATSPALRVDVNGATEAVSTTWAGNSEPLAAVAFPVADAWLEDHLDVTGARLVRLAGRRLLRTTRLAPVALDARDGCRFSDGAPLSLLGEASVRDLGRKVPDRALTPARFRPNLVFAGARAYAESGWTRLRVGRVPVRSLMDCYRCSMVAVVQAAESGDRAGERPNGLEPLRRLKDLLRRDADTHGPLPRDAPNLAVYAAPDATGGVVRVGDEVAVLDTVAAPAASIWAHNVARHPETFSLDDDRFWHSEGPKRAAKSKGV